MTLALIRRTLIRPPVALAVALALIGGAAMAQTPRHHATLAMVAEPQTLDPMASTADLVGTIMQHVYEPLYTFDAKWNVVPMLAVWAGMLVALGLLARRIARAPRATAAEAANPRGLIRKPSMAIDSSFRHPSEKCSVLLLSLRRSAIADTVYRVQVIDRALSIINLLAASNHPLGAWEAGVQLGLNKSTVHRLLAVLEHPFGCYDVRRYDGDYDKMVETVMNIYRGRLFLDRNGDAP